MNNIMNKKIILIGLGPHAKRIYLKYLKGLNCLPILIVDLLSEKEKITNYLSENGLTDIDTFFVNDKNRDDLELDDEVKKFLKDYIKKNKVTHAIISTEPRAHFSYAMFLLDCGINILMDKPITSPKNVILNSLQAEKIREEYEQLCEKYKMKKLVYPNLNFSIQCQRRFQKGYLFIYDLLKNIIKEYNIPISYIDIYHNDGMWNMPNEFCERQNHPYQFGYGKIFHSGYHFIDLLTWFIDLNKNLTGKFINKCSVYSEAYKPYDFFYNFNENDYYKFFKTNKFDLIIKNRNKVKNFGEIDVHSVINFYNDSTLITNCSLNLMQSGFSRRSWVDLPKDTYKGNGRVRHERINIMVGPLMNIQIHSYQAYEVKERALHGSSDVGDLEHFDIYIFRNVDLIGGKPFEKISLKNLEIKKEDNFIGYNERARENCLKDFLIDKVNDSNILLHRQSILITEMIYKSLIFEGKKMNFDFNLKQQQEIKNIAVITDSDFNLPIEKNNKEPVVRFGARGIILNEENKIAVFYEENKNQYKLPGGGIEENENPKQAFIRECKEEVGADVEITKELGCVIEEKSKDNFKQLSFVYVAKAIGEIGKQNLTDQEKEEGAKVIWLSKLEALERMKNCLSNLKQSKYDSVYRSQFMVLRDIKILEYFIDEVE